MLQNEPNWKLYLFDKNMAFLTTVTAQNENISPNWTEANEEANKAAGRSRDSSIQFGLRSIGKKKTAYKVRLADIF